MRVSLIAIFCWTISSFSYAEVNFETAYADSLADIAKNKSGREGVLFLIENFYSVFSRDYDDGIKWGELALFYAKKMNDEQLIGRSYLKLGSARYLRGQYDKSFSYYKTALDIFESIEDHAYIGRTHNELSVYYRKQKQYEKAIESLNIAYKQCNLAGDFVCIETSFNNRGVTYELMGNFSAALKSYRKAEQLAEENENQIGLSYIYNNYSEVYRKMQLFDSAIYYVNKSSKIREQIGDRQGVAINWTNLGDLYLEMGDYVSAELWLKKGFRLAQEVNYPDLQRHIYEQRYQIEKAKGNFDKALTFIEKSQELKDSLLNEEKIKSLSEMEVKYETEKVERKFAEEETKRKESELKVANRNNWIIGISSVTIILILGGLVLYQRRLKRAQEEKNKAVLVEKEKGLRAVFDATEKERQRIAKDLHDGVGQQMSGLKLAWENLSVNIARNNPNHANKINDLSEILDETATDVREISHQMMPKVLTEFGLIPAIEQMLEKSLKHSEINYHFEHFNVSKRPDRRVELALYRVAQELVNNVMKHSKASELTLQLFQNKGQIILVVEDDGVGFDASLTDGYGLLNIQTRLNSINGSINYESPKGSGTTAIVRVESYEGCQYNEKLS